MQKKQPFPYSSIYLAISAVLLSQHVQAAPLSLSTAPPGTSYKAPAPNVIVSVDDSGSMGASGMRTLREALKKTFTAENVPDHSIRLGWQAMTGCYNIPMAGDCKGQNEVRVLDATHRTRFDTWVNTLRPQGGTPSHRMLVNAGEYYKQSPSAKSPWASVPGTTQNPMLGCRKSYNLFMTDGGWNDSVGKPWNWIGNEDGTSKTLPDGTSYDATSPNTQIYRDTFGSTALPTLADVAFYYWATDLQPSLSNIVPKRVAHEGNETFSSGRTTRTIPEYWNPRNDPATWQHMITYTVGFNTAANWSGRATPNLGSDTWTGGDYDALMVGNKTWTNPITGNEDTRMPELWHMALNSRGKYVPAPDADSLAVAFQDIMNTIQADQSAPITSLTGSAYSTAIASTVFSAGYAGADWSGYVTAYPVTARTAAVSVNGAWGNLPGISPPKPVSTASLMDADDFSPANRLVLSHDGSNGIAWNWASLATDQKLSLNTLSGQVDTKGPDRLAFLRGDRSKEQKKGGTFRNRSSRHGDIVNSKLWHVPGKPNSGYTGSAYSVFRAQKASRSPMLYVGVNDGMLHGFAAANGQEKIAYVPQGLHPKLAPLTAQNYEHRYYVDGSPLSGDLETSSGWKTYLAGFLGAGGRGYFVLDVSNPDQFASATPSTLVVMDKTASVDADVGHILNEPVRDSVNPAASQQITKMNDGRWALVMGNGVNSTNEQAVLLIQYLDGAKELLKLKAGTAGDNGLGAPRLVDLNGDRIPDVAYAGDLQGNLWRFDLNSPESSGWKASFSGTPLFVAKNPAGQTQSITAAPAWLPHPEGGLMVSFGTGQDLTNNDRGTTSVQSIYGVWDRTLAARASGNKMTFTGGSAITDGRTTLVAQTSSTNPAGTSDHTGARVWNLSSNEVSYVGPNAKNGWYIDLPFSGERVIANLEWFDGQLLDIESTIPSVGSTITEESCSATASSTKKYLNTVNGITGAAPKSQIYAYTLTTPVTGDPMSGSRIETSLRWSVRSKTEELNLGGGGGGGGAPERRNLLPSISQHPSWRQFQ